MSKNSDVADAAVAALGVVGIAGIGAFLWFIVRGFVMSKLWGWFMVPFGLMPLGIAHAVGLSCLSGMFLPIASRAKNESTLKTTSGFFLQPLLALLIGFIVHKVFM